MLCLPAFAADWYVAPNGVNSTCTSGAPCQSLNYVFTNKFSCGDTIHAKGGNYYIPLTESNTAITWPTCNSSSGESTLVAFNYGWGAVLTPVIDSNGAINAVTVTNGASACLNGFCGTYTGTISVGAVCPGLASANTSNLAPSSQPCGSGFTATATVGGGAITGITVLTPGTGYPPNVQVFAQGGQLPVFSDLMQVFDSTNCSGANCGFNGSSYAATNCATGNAGQANGCLIVTNSADNNDPNFGSCVTTACDGWLATVPSNYVFHDTAFYQPGAGCPTACNFSPIFRRQVGITPLKNQIPKNCDTTMCVTAANQGAANVAFGCPSGGVLQPVRGGGTAGFNCAAQVTPATGGQWFGGYIQWEYNTHDFDNPHALLIGDMRISCQEIWTYCELRLHGLNPGTPNVARATGPASTQDGSNAGFIPGHQYYLKNRPADVKAGQWYLDRCPSQWTGSSSCNSGTPESSWKIFTAASTAQGESAQTDTYWIPQMAPPLMIATTMNNFQIIGVTFQGGNYPVPANSIASTQGQPNIPEVFVFGTYQSTTLMQNITMEGVIFQHTGAEGVGFHGNIQNITIKDSAFSDCWGACIRVGDVAVGTDVCSGGSQNVPSNFVFQNNLINGVQREDPTGESLGLYIGDVSGWTVDHNDMFRFMIGMVNNGHGLNLGAEAGQLAYCMGNWTFSNNHIEGEFNSGNTLNIGADNGIVYGAWNHAPSSPAASLFSDPFPTAANYTGQFFGNVILHGGCDPNLSFVDHCGSGFYGDQGSWGVNMYNNIIGYVGSEEVEAHLSSHGQGTFGASVFVPQHFYLHNNIFWGCGSSLIQQGSVYRRGSIALGTFIIDQNIEVCDTTANNINPNGFYRQNLFNGFWAAYDQSDATITNHGSPTCAGAVSCASPASATVVGCTGATVTVSVDSISGAYSGLMGVLIQNAGTGCSSPTLSWTNCPSCAATLCTSGGSLVSCTPTAVPATTAFKFGGNGNVIWDPRGSSPIGGLCKIPGCNTGSNLYALLNWQNIIGEDVGSVNCDPLFVDPTYPALNFKPTNLPCLNKVGFVMWDYTTAGRSFPVIGANTPTNLYPALSEQLVPDSTYNAAYIVRPVNSMNPAGGSGYTVWK